jgi:hypothetical protein
MSRTHKVEVALCALLVAFAGRPAHAADAGDSEPWDELPAAPAVPQAAPVELEGAAAPDMVSLRLVSDSRDVTMSIYTPDRKLVKACSVACTVSLEKGRYLIGTRVSGDEQETFRGLRLNESKELRVAPGNKSVSNFGLGLGIVGGALLVGGFTTVFVSGGSHSSPGNQDALTAGAIAMLAGIPCSAVGWPLFGGYRRPSFDELPASAELEAPHRESAEAHIADSSGPTWGMSYGWSF